MNKVIKTLMSHKSVRRYKKIDVLDEKMDTIVKAGQQAAFAGQFGSVLLTRKKEYRFFQAPVFLIMLADVHRMEVVMKERGWTRVMNDLGILLFAIQDACYMAQNIVIAAESYGLGTCYIGGIPYLTGKIREDFELPEHVFPLVGLTIGYPDENEPVRPRYPLDFSLFKEKYPDFSEKQIKTAMKVMDEGYLKQDYYRKNNAKIRLESESEDRFSYENYSWTEHIARKWGQWYPAPEKILEQFQKAGFELNYERKNNNED